MAGEWPKVLLGELAQNFDSRRVPLSSRERAKRRGVYPYYGATGVMDNVDKFLFEGMHLLVAEDGSVERPDGKPFLQLVDGKFWVNNHAHVLRAASDEDTKFLYYALSTVSVRPYMSGSVQAKLSQANLNRIPIPYPTQAVDRRAIAHLLGTLDDKIELNRRMAQTLEEMARALFKSWFVDFDPVRAKAEGRDPGLPEHLADLFPDRLVDSELGEIPEGWSVTTAGEEFRITMGQSPPGDTYNDVGDGLPFYQGRVDFGSRFPRRRVYCSAPTRVAEVGDTLVSVRAPVGDVNMAAERCAIGRGVAAVRHSTGACSYTFQAMKEAGHHFTKFNSEGTVFGAINKKDFEGLLCPGPPPDVVAEFERQVEGIDGRIAVCTRSIVNLAVLRDVLLPKLVSGELRLPDPEGLLARLEKVA